MTEPVYHDQLVPFMINEAPVRGRVVRLAGVVDRILKRHDYPDTVSKLLAETLTLASMLASNLKQNGIFTVQIQSKGAIRLMVVDAAFGGNLRGYAEFDEVALAEVKGHDLPALFGEGYLAITLDPGEAGQRYQGVVPLEGGNITAAMQRYFKDSQQLKAQFHVAVGSQLLKGESDAQWIAGGIYIEHMPDAAGHLAGDDEPWNRSSALLSTVQDNELLSLELDLNDLLHLLFHEDGVWVYPPQPLQDACRCSREKIEQTLKPMPRQELEFMVEDGKITVDCQFCNSEYAFTLEELTIPS